MNAQTAIKPACRLAETRVFRNAGALFRPVNPSNAAAGNIRGNRRAFPASAGKARWFLFRTANRRFSSPSGKSRLTGAGALSAFGFAVLAPLGLVLEALSAKNICSPAVKTNSAPHSPHFRTRSWYSMSRSQSPAILTGLAACFPDAVPVRRRSGANSRHFWSPGHKLHTEPRVVHPNGARSILFAALLFSEPLARKRLFGATLFSWLHVEAVLFDFLNDVFLLHLPLEAA